MHFHEISISRTSLKDIHFIERRKNNSYKY